MWERERVFYFPNPLRPKHNKRDEPRNTYKRKIAPAAAQGSILSLNPHSIYARFALSVYVNQCVEAAAVGGPDGGCLTALSLSLSLSAPKWVCGVRTNSCARSAVLHFYFRHESISRQHTTSSKTCIISPAAFVAEKLSEFQISSNLGKKWFAAAIGEQSLSCFLLLCLILCMKCGSFLSTDPCQYKVMGGI